MVPEGWSTHKISDLPGSHGRPVTKLGPFGSALKKSDYTPSGYKVYGQQQVLAGDQHFGDYWIGEEKFARLEACSVRPGDILLSTMGSFGSVLRLTDGCEPGIINPRLLRLSVNRRLALPEYLEIFLKSDLAMRQFVSFAQGGTMPAVNGASVSSLQVLLPPIDEQRRIAEILGTWDRAIETTEKLITASEAQKKALMQQLLTARKRLPGFTKPWRRTTLGGLGEVIVSNVDKKSVEGETAVRLCNYMDVYARDRIDADQDFMPATATAAQIARFGLHAGDVIITKDSERPDDIAIPSVVASTAPDLICGYHLAIIRPGQHADGQFVKYLLEEPSVRHHFATRFGLTLDAIQGAPLSIPVIDEQRAIARVIASAEAEPALLTSRLQKLKTEKAALMQQLLTGRRRVNLQELAA